MLHLNPDENVVFGNPNVPSAGFAKFFDAICREIGAAVELPSDVLLKKFDASYSVARGALQEAWEAVNMRRAWFVDWWTGKPIEGNFILLDEFLQDLNEVASCKSLTIRMNSYGGDAGVSITIHNRLRELQANGMKITCVVDGVAMSGGSLIMCACDNVRVNPSSLVMIHKCFAAGGRCRDYVGIHLLSVK